MQGPQSEQVITSQSGGGGGGGTSLGIFEWECAAGTLESCTRASSREFGHPLFLLH